MARRRFFVDSIKRGHAELRGDHALHLTRVLRVEPGEQFEISDNSAVYLAEVETARRDLVSFAVIEALDAPVAVVQTILLASLTKFDRFEWALEKATEVGVGRIVPVLAERSEKGLDLAAGKRVDRWLRIVREASEQSRRSRLPELQPSMGLIAALGCEADYHYALDEGEAQPIMSSLPSVRSPEHRVALLLGPEGGWTDRERTAIAAANWTAVSLGHNILRAETAAIAGLAIIHAWWAAQSS